MTRTFFIGDVHGCIDELRDLLDAAALTAGDRIVSLGDLTRKGPDPAGCARLIRDRGGVAVLGNNEEKLLQWRRRVIPRLFANAHDRRQMGDRDLMSYCASLPTYLDFPELGVVAVHGGVLPNAAVFSPELVPREAALKLRWIARAADGQWEQRGKTQAAGEVFWAGVWGGDRMVVYGHTPRAEPRIDPCAIGIDTGCVYGGKLTGVLFAGRGEWRIVQVSARKPYAQ